MKKTNNPLSGWIQAMACNNSPRNEFLCSSPSRYVLGVLCLMAVIFCGGCSTESTSDSKRPQKAAVGEYIYRLHHEKLFTPPLPEMNQRETYPWEKQSIGHLPKITKEYFRCKGSALNPIRTVVKKGEAVHYNDCGGCEKHSLPLRDNKEFIYPILVDLLNYVQKKTGRRVVITSGHRCPDHNAYINPEHIQVSSKHLMGAEVAFYVQGMEEQPEKIVKVLQQYYQETPKYHKENEYVEFKRYEKEDTDVFTKPWFNKEIFIKLYARKEGRNFDNRHPYPYLSLQVRYDWDLKEKVVFTWPKGYNNFYRK